MGTETPSHVMEKCLWCAGQMEREILGKRGAQGPCLKNAISEGMPANVCVSDSSGKTALNWSDCFHQKAQAESSSKLFSPFFLITIKSQHLSI